MIVFMNVKERSERVPRKNFREIDGVPLWKRAALKFAGDRVYIDTDAAEILAACENDPALEHVTAISRLPEHRAGEPGLAMFLRFIERLADPSEPVAIVNCTAPFVRAETVRRAAAMIGPDGPDCVLSATEIRDFAYRRQGGRFIPLNHDHRGWPRTQDLEPILVLNHAFYVLVPAAVMRLRHRIGDRPLLYPLAFPETHDIDWEEDWTLAEAIAGTL